MLLALLATATVLAPAPAPAQQEAPQLVVISAHADRARGTLVVTGLDFGEEEPPRVTLGVDDLEVLEHSQGRIEAVLPPTFPAGSYLLIVARGPAIQEYDVFHASVPELVTREAAPAAPLTGARGPMGPVGPAGAAGPPGPSGRAELAGRRCAAGSYLAGFDATGELVCTELPAAAPAPDAAPPDAAATTAAAGAPPAAALPAPCGADDAGNGADLPGAWSPRVPVVAGYPAATAGELRGRFGGGDAADLLALAGTESRGRWCLANERDRPLVATLELASLTAGASVCACWSGMGEPCALSRNVCASGAAGQAVELAVPMRMLCGVADSGFLEVEVRPADGAGCADWRLGWSIAE